MDYVTLGALIVACGGAASTGAMFSPGVWYDRLDKPRWTPPGWMFPTVWSILYILIIWSAWRISGTGVAAAVPALALWGAQMVLNALWSPIFFGLKRMGAAFLVLCLLWLAVAATMVAFALVDWVAGLMFVPYLVWVTAAGLLNLSVWRRNPGAAQGLAVA